MATMMRTRAIDIEALPFRHESQRRLLREHPDWVEFKPFAPARPRIVFDRFFPRTGGRQIFSMEADGTDVQNLSKNPSFDDGAPAWSADRTKIVFARSTRGSGLWALWLMNADGTQQVPLTTPPAGTWDTEPVWSPDGSKIAFSRFWEIWTVEPDGANAQPVMDYSVENVLDHMPTWRFDSTAVAFCREWLGFGIIAVAETTTTAPVVQYVTAPNKARWDAWPAWSPKADVIAFCRNDTRDMQIWTINGDGDASSERALSRPDTAHGQYDQAPCWSGDGQRIAFDRTVLGSHIWTMDLSGGNQEDLSVIGRPPEDPSDSLPNWD